MLRGLTLSLVVNRRHVAWSVWGRSHNAVCVIGADCPQMTRVKLVLLPCLKQLFPQHTWLRILIVFL